MKTEKERRIMQKTTTVVFSVIAAALCIIAISPIALADSHEARLSGLYDVQKPEGKGPFPAVVAVSGCSGFHTRFVEPVYDKLVSDFRDAGFVTIRVDYIGARNLDSCYPGYLAVTKDEVVADIFLAIKHLLDSGFVKPSSINLVGWSYGGGSVLQALSKMPERPDIKIGAAVAYYPDCRTVDKWNAAVPLLVLFGGEDDVAPPAICKELFIGEVSKHIKVEEYPGAHHAFDLYTLPPKTTYRFGTVGYHKEAAEKAWAALMAFLVR